MSDPRNIANQFIPQINMGPAGVAAIQGGADLLGTLVNKIGAKRRYNRAKRDQYQMAEYQYGKNLEQWNRENEYNSPEQTMKRLKEAGLNPHLAYGTGTQGNTAASSPDYDAGTVQKQDPTNFDLGRTLGDSLGAYNDTRMRNAQIDQVREVTKGQEIENNMEYLNKEIKKHEAKKKGIDADQAEAEYENYTKYQGDYLDQRNRINEEKVKNMIFENEWKKSPEYKKNREKWEAKRGKSENVVEFMESVFERYPELQKRILQKVDDAMSIFGY